MNRSTSAPRHSFHSRVLKYLPASGPILQHYPFLFIPPSPPLLPPPQLPRHLLTSLALPSMANSKGSISSTLDVSADEKLPSTRTGSSTHIDALHDGIQDEKIHDQVEVASHSSDDDVEYPSFYSLTLITIALCLAVFLIALVSPAVSFLVPAC